MSEKVVISTDGGRIWTAASGTGVPVLLISGGPGCCDYLEPVAELIEQSCLAIRFDARGCGRSSESQAYSIEQSLADIESIRAAYGIERWIVAGHSWGADLALIYALHFPELTQGFICLSGGRMNNDRDWSAAYQAGRDAGLEVQPEFDFPPNLEVNAQVNADAKRFIKRPDLWREIVNLHVPALFIYGDRDIRPSWPVEQVSELLPQATFHLLEGADHFLWRTHAEELRMLMTGFIAQR